jgi:Rrf2 family protein
MNGVRIMIDLVQHDGQGPQVSRAIAERQDINVKYVDPIVNDLRRHELIASVRGRDGGYLLARPANKITVGQIVRCLDTPYTPSDVVDDRPLESVLEQLQNAVWKVLDRTTLAKLAKKRTKRAAK